MTQGAAPLHAQDHGSAAGAAAAAASAPAAPSPAAPPSSGTGSAGSTASSQADAAGKTKSEGGKTGSAKTRVMTAKEDLDSTGKKRPHVAGRRPTASNVTINLVNLLVQQHVLTEDQAKALIKQAEDEAYVAREDARDAKVKADEASRTASAAAAAAMPPGTKRVTYVPEIVKRQIRDDLRKEVLAEAKTEGWASPGKLPDWVSRVRLYGDFRMRYQGNFFPSGNDNSGNLVDFNAINTGNPYDPSTGGYPAPPSIDSDQNRERFLLRARLGIDADLYDGFTAGMRIATGDSSSPVSTNQVLGNSGGNFSKYALWLDRGYLKYQPNEHLAVSVGRFDNPFYAPSDLAWYRELAFDGLAVQAKYPYRPDFEPFAVAGAFPIYNTTFNVGTDLSGQKYSSTDKYLFGGQLGFRWKPYEHVTVSFGGGFYDFNNVQGRLSDPCYVTSTSDVCDTDTLRPSFAQKGNTYMALRNIVPLYTSSGTLGPQYQYYGLASAFRPVILTSRVDLAHFDPVHVLLDGEFIKNTAFNAAAISAIAVNNRAGTTDGSTGGFEGGDTGYMARITVGHPEMTQLWDWNVSLAYKYLQSDATVDAFTDPDFGLGGTNLRGYIIGGNLGLSRNTWLTIRWLSAGDIAGPAYHADTLQVDLNAKF